MQNPAALGFQLSSIIMTVKTSNRHPILGVSRRDADGAPTPSVILLVRMKVSHCKNKYSFPRKLKRVFPYRAIIVMGV